MKGLTIRAKLAGIVTLLTVTAALILLIGIVQMGKINQTIAYITGVIDPQQTSATTLQQGLMSAIRSQKNAVIDTTDEASQKDADLSRKAVDDFEKELANLQKMFKDDPNPQTDQMEIIAKIPGALNEFRTVNNTTLDLAVRNTNLKATTLLYGDLDRIGKTVLEKAGKLAQLSAGGGALRDIGVQCAEIKYQLGKHINSSGAEEMASLEKDIKAEIELTRSDLDKFKSAGQAQADAVSDVQQNYEQFSKAAAQIIAYSTENTNNRSSELSSGEAKQKGLVILDLLSSLNDSLDKQMSALRIDSAKTYANARATMLAVGLIGLAVSIALAWGVMRGILKAIKSTTVALADIAEGDGDLTKRVPIISNDEMGELSGYVNKFIEKIHGIISHLASVSQQVASAATELSATSEQMASGSAQQSEQTTQISAAIEEMSSTVQQVAQKASEAVTQARTAGDQAHEGGKVVKQTMDGMDEISQVVNESSQSVMMLGQKSGEIGAIINVINDIADQTNLLALNAAIEAARAGEHGRGFAVVADEVRKLAERTTQATKEVSQSITAIQQETGMAVDRMSNGTKHVSKGVELAREAGRSLDAILDDTGRVTSVIETIAAAAEQQASAAEEIARSIENITSVTQQSADGASQASTVASELSAKSEELRDIVSQFKL